MDLQLTGKTALITGSSQGIGLATAQALASEGVDVALCARNAAQVGAAATSIQSEYGVKALGVAVDVTNPADIDRLVQVMESDFGGVDILIDNAGAGSEETIMEATDERWQHYWDLHVMAAVRLARGVVPSMRQRGGGVILHNASICAKQPLPHEPIYNVTKAALVMFSKCLANELIGDNIRVNCINPGLVMTEGWIEPVKQWTAGTETTWQQYLDNVARQYAPIGRFATPQEVADFLTFLCSPRAAYCVGSTYYIDGGWLATTT
jgi:NAD(P)-dependent dehydrogenase (short-subunit alcohol dehydrogenase family)